MSACHLILPGLGGSGPDHWQSRWENLLPKARRVAQADWDNPKLADWIECLGNTVAECGDDVVLVAHSLACVLVAHWAQFSVLTKTVRAALLVAPADVDTVSATVREVQDFAPVPLRPLPFKSLVVASANDPYAALARSAYFAKAWQADFVDVGELGHINSQSCLGDWPQGLRLLSEFCAR